MQYPVVHQYIQRIEGDRYGGKVRIPGQSHGVYAPAERAGTAFDRSLGEYGEQRRQ